MRAETFKTPGHVKLNVRVPEGSVEIEAVEGLTETNVSLRARSGREEDLEDSLVQATGSEGKFEVTVQAPEAGFRLFGFKSREVDVNIRCPAGTDLTVKVVSAPVRARGRFGKCEINAVSGDVSVDRVEGDAWVKTVSGDAAIENVAGRTTGQTVSGDFRAEHIGADTELKTVSGHFRLGRVDGPVTAQTVSGDIELASLLKGAVSLKTISGDVDIGIRRGSRLWIDARSMSGRTTSEMPVSDEQQDVDGPMVELRATVTSGNIRVRRAS